MNVLKAVDLNESVKRVILTSSVAACVNVVDPANHGKVIDER
jgi:hypothetical protein